MKKKAVLAYSGGLDTTFCLNYLAVEKQLDVITVLANTGGFNENELSRIEQQALQMGAVRHFNIDISEEYFDKCIKYLLYGNILRNGNYPLSVSSERVFQAIAVVKKKKKENACCIAHGCTSAGNDQVRFDMIFQTLAPEIEILSPVRDLGLSREAEIEYLKKNGIEMNWEKHPYSINKGLWGTSIGGKETLTSHLPLPESAFPSKLKETKEKECVVEFENGSPAAIDNTRCTAVNIIKKLNELAAPYAVGRGIHTGDTIIGIKGRVGFEASAPVILTEAHKTLEKHVLSKWQLYWKEILGNWYGMHLHEGLYLEPVMRDIEKFLEHSQQRVSGKVHLRLRPYTFEITGISSPYDLMKAGGTKYGEETKAWTPEEVKGFIKIMANQQKNYHSAKNND